MKSKLLFFLALLSVSFPACDKENEENTDPDSPALGIPLDSTAYQEKHRPQFHFSPPEKWMNDPNGMVYYEGEYHLFYQHHPEKNVWGPMHWGHAVSRDMVNWVNLPIALYPDDLGYIFSGSAVIDKNNTSGLKSGEEDVMVAIFTHHDPRGEATGSKTYQYQSLAYSNDKGRSWTKYSGNPVLKNPGIKDFRDPKVFWHQASGQWVMVLASFDRVRIYNSPNLIEWEEVSEFGADWGSHGGVWECPDLFPLEVNGNPLDKKWMMIVSIPKGGPNGGSATQYFVGDFDGKEFTLEREFANAIRKGQVYVPKGDVFEDFERNRYGNWETEGKAFRKGPAKGDFRKQEEVVGYEGKRLVNSFHKGLDAQGKMLSDPFPISKSFINFLMGGGNHPGKTCMNLLIADSVVRTATGNNSDSLVWRRWNVDKYRGQQARLEIVDEYSLDWGYILVDQISFADAAVRSTEEKAMWLDHGKDNYAGVSWSNISPRDGRRLFIGWMSNWQYAQEVPTEAWRSAMTLPREIELVRLGSGLRALSHPVAELKELRKNEDAIDIPKRSINSDFSSLASIRMDTPLVELLLDLEVEPGATGGIVLHNDDMSEELRIGYDRQKSRMYVDRRKAGKVNFSEDFASRIHFAPLSEDKELLKLHIFVDLSSIEIFAANGEVVMTEIFFPTEAFSKIGFFSENGSSSLKGSAWMLNSIWK